MSPPTLPADVIGIDIDRDHTLTVSLSTAAGAARARTALTPTERAAIPHVNAIWGPGGHGHVRGDVVRGVLRRAVSALGYAPPVLVIRPGDRPAFWLQLQRGTETRDLTLGILDVVALLIGDRVDVAIELEPSRAA